MTEESTVTKDFTENATIYISDKSKLNITFNLCQCGQNEIQPEGSLHIHANDTFTLGCIYEGNGRLDDKYSAYKMDTESGFFAFPDLDYELLNTGKDSITVIWLSFTGFSVEGYLNRANISKQSPIFGDDKGGVHDRLKRLYETSKTFPNRYCPMMSIMYDIFSYLLDENPTKVGESFVDNADRLAVEFVHYIQLNYSSNLTVEEIADALGITKKALYKVCERSLHLPPKQYLIYYRIEKACARLKIGDQSIQEIAESVGYANQFYFAKEFKRITGMTASEYRKNPELSEVLSYWNFMPTIETSHKTDRTSLKVEEPVISIYRSLNG